MAIESDRHERMHCFDYQEAKKVGYTTNKLNAWMPHEVTRKNLMSRISSCDSMLNEIRWTHF